MSRGKGGNSQERWVEHSADYGGMRRFVAGETEPGSPEHDRRMRLIDAMEDAGIDLSALGRASR